MRDFGFGGLATSFATGGAGISRGGVNAKCGSATSGFGGATVGFRNREEGFTTSCAGIRANNILTVPARFRRWVSRGGESASSQ